VGSKLDIWPVANASLWWNWSLGWQFRWTILWRHKILLRNGRYYRTGIGKLMLYQETTSSLQNKKGTRKLKKVKTKNYVYANWMFAIVAIILHFE